MGYIDGTQIFVENNPSKPNKGATAYWLHKRQYGLFLLCAVDHRKRFTYVHHGLSARSSDIRAQCTSVLHTFPAKHFSLDEFLLGDLGFIVSENIIPMYKKGWGEGELTGRRVSHTITRLQIPSANVVGFLQ